MSALELKIKAVIGFGGKVPGALLYTPCGKYIVYPLGSFIVIKNLRTDKEAFLDAHTHEVSCITVSKNGRRLASGELQLHGVKAGVIVWDLERAKQLLDNGKTMIGDDCALLFLKQHIGKVQSVAFSSGSNYLSTLGGQDDNALVIWDVATGTPVCGSPAGSDSGLVCKWFHGRNDRLVTVGYYHIRVWQVDLSLPKLQPVDVKLGSLRRIFNCMDITADDKFAFCGSTTGDLVKITLDRDEVHSFNNPDAVIPNLLGVTKERISLGINAAAVVINPSTGNYNVVVGGGDGTLTYINPTLGVCKGNTTTLKGGVTSICENPINGKLIIGTDQCNRYEVSRDLMEADLKLSCHFGAVNDVAFPAHCPELIISSSKGDVRVWNLVKKQELLRIQVPNIDCLCSLVTPNGGLIVSGWEDGKIRSFLPETGKMKFTIQDAHDKVTSIAIVANANNNDPSIPWRIVSGGSEGKVRIWNITNSHQVLISSLKEHRGSINCLKVTPDNNKCISACSDGSCIVWDLNRYVRISAIFESNIFQAVVIHPDESQYVTCGSNHKISYWDSTNGEAIRIIDGGEGIMTCLDIDAYKGDFFVSGCEDKLVKLWHYDEGEALAIGRGHSGVIKAVRISPDQKSIVSVGSTGEIIFWELPSISDIQSQQQQQSNHK